MIREVGVLLVLLFSLQSAQPAGAAGAPAILLRPAVTTAGKTIDVSGSLRLRGNPDLENGDEGVTLCGVLVAIVGAILLAQGPQALTSTTTSASFTMPVSCTRLEGLADPNCTPGATNPT